MPMRIHRCAFCAAPLEKAMTAVNVICRYCDTENFLQGNADAKRLSERLKLAHAQSRVMQTEAQAKAALLLEKFQTALLNGHKEDSLRHYEGYLRLQQAAAIHLCLHGMEPEHAEATLEQIETSILQAVREFARAQGLEGL